MKNTYFILLLMLLVSSCSQSKLCTIEGVVVDRPESKTLWLAPFNTDYRVVAPIEIPINEDGSFAYSFEVEPEPKVSELKTANLGGVTWILEHIVAIYKKTS